jgi:hypothetical protein
VTTYRVRSFPAGHILVPGPEVFWMSHFDQWLPLTFQVVLIQGAGVNALVNTGLPADISDLNRMWGIADGDPKAASRGPGETIQEILATAGLAPADITHVLVTPFQRYCTDNIPLFERAEICLSRRGWVHLHTSHSHPHDDRWSCIERDVLVHLVTEAWDRVRLIDADAEICAGLRAWESGVHHRASLTVEVETATGTAAISDSFFYAQNVLEGPHLGINESLEEHLVFAERVRRQATHLVPLYDPGVFERHPGGMIAP